MDIYERDSKQLVDAGSLNDGENTAVKTFGNHGKITHLQHIIHVSIIIQYEFVLIIFPRTERV